MRIFISNRIDGWQASFLISIFVAGILLLVTTTSVALAQDSVQIRTKNYVADPGISTDAAIEIISNDVAVGAIKVEVAYDPEVISMTSCALNDFQGVCNNPTSDTVVVAGVNTNGISKNAQIATISFDPIGSPGQSSPLTITVVTLADTAGTTLGSSLSDGAILIRDTLSGQSAGSNRVFLPLVGRNQFQKVTDEPIQLSPDQVFMSWICSLMQNFGWTADACYI